MAQSTKELQARKEKLGLSILTRRSAGAACLGVAVAVGSLAAAVAEQPGETQIAISHAADWAGAIDTLLVTGGVIVLSSAADKSRECSVIQAELLRREFPEPGE